MILSFNDNTEKFRDTGKKSYNLARCIGLGLNVPKYVCITEEDCKDGALTKDASKRLRQVLKGAFPKKALYAVRVSPNLEGVGGLTFGEQFETFLNVSLDDLEAYVERSLSMGRSKRIASYVKRHGVDRPLELNVMVQEMCPYDLCGVLYTANPAGVLSERVITVGGDTCNATLDPDGTSNTYYYNADGYAYLVRNDDRYLLDEPTTEALSSVADTLKTALSKDVRVDFCVRGGRVYVLQVDTVEEPSEGVVTLHRTKEFLKGVSAYPLTNSFIKQCNESILSNLLLHLTHSPELVKANEETIRHTLNVYNGRTFYNLDHLYGLFSLFPFNDKLTPVLEKEFQVQSQEDPSEGSTEDPEVNASSRLSQVLSVFKLLTSNHRSAKGVSDGFAEVEKVFNDCYCDELSDIQLKSLYRVVFSKTVSRWDTDIINSIYCYFYAYLLKKLFKKDVDVLNLDSPPKMDVEGGIAGTLQQRILDGLSSQEANRGNQERLYQYVEKIFMHMGTNLVRLDYLDRQEDVYYLTVDELFNESAHSYKELVAKRKALYEFYERLPDYRVVTFNGRVLSKSANRHGDVVVL